MNKYKLVILFGPHGAGKKTLLNYIVKKYPNVFNEIISYTTKEKENNEIEGKNYHFISIEEFTEKVLNGSIIEATEQDGDFYGSDISTFVKNKINIKILDEKGIECLIDNSNIELHPIFIVARQKTRLIRLLKEKENQDCEKICRNFLEDIKNFDKEFDFEYNVYYNGDEIDLSYFNQKLYE